MSAEDERQKLIKEKCLRSIVPLLPVATMKKVQLLLDNPRLITEPHLQLTEEEGKLVADLLRKEMEKVERIANCLNARNAQLDALRDINISNGVKRALEIANDIKKSLQMIQTDQSNKAMEIFEALTVITSRMETRTQSAEEKIASFKKSLDGLNKVSDAMDDILTNEANRVREETERVEKQLAPYRAIPDIDDYVREHKRLVESIKALEHMRDNMPW